MKNKLVYKYAEEFLYNHLPEGYKINDLSVYLNESAFKPTTINDVYKSFLSSLQNYQMMPNIIKFELRKESFSEILFGFDPIKVLNSFDFDSLYDTLWNEYNFKYNKESKASSWVKYTKGILSSAKFVSRFNNYSDFDGFVSSFNYNEYSQAALPMLIEKEIHGMGFALACDFLKELGYHHYPKPDVHLNDLFKAVGLSDGTGFDTYKAIIFMAKEVDETPYKVDKIFWLISSGNYYIEKIKIKPQKKALIKHLQQKLNLLETNK